MARERSDQEEDPSPKGEPSEGGAEPPSSDEKLNPFERKDVLASFREEEDIPAPPSAFEDKRFGAFRKQMAWAVAGLGLVVVLVGVVIWLDLTDSPDSEEVAISAPAEPLPPRPPSPEEIRAARLADLRGRLQRALQGREWAQIDLLAGEILAIDPLDGEAWHARGWVQERNADIDGAIDSYGKAIDAGFLPPHPLLKRAAMYRLKGKYPEAIQDLEQAIRLDSASAVAPNLLLITQIQSGQAESVRHTVQTFEKAGVVANADRYLLGKAALALQDGNINAAAESLAAFRSIVPQPLFSVLMQDRFFDPYRSNPALQPFLFIP